MCEHASVNALGRVCRSTTTTLTRSLLKPGTQVWSGTPSLPFRSNAVSAGLGCWSPHVCEWAERPKASCTTLDNLCYIIGKSAQRLPRQLFLRQTPNPIAGLPSSPAAALSYTLPYTCRTEDVAARFVLLTKVVPYYDSSSGVAGSACDFKDWNLGLTPCDWGSPATISCTVMSDPSGGSATANVVTSLDLSYCYGVAPFNPPFPEDLSRLTNLQSLGWRSNNAAGVLVMICFLKVARSRMRDCRLKLCSCT